MACRLNFLKHIDVHPGLVLKFKPKLTVQVTCFFGLHIQKFVVAFDLLIYFRLVLFYSKYKVIFDDNRCSEPS